MSEFNYLNKKYFLENTPMAKQKIDDGYSLDYEEAKLPAYCREQQRSNNSNNQNLIQIQERKLLYKDVNKNLYLNGYLNNEAFSNYIKKEQTNINDEDIAFLFKLYQKKESQLNSFCYDIVDIFNCKNAEEIENIVATMKEKYQQTEPTNDVPEPEPDVPEPPLPNQIPTTVPTATVIPTKAPTPKPTKAPTPKPTATPTPVATDIPPPEVEYEKEGPLL